METADGAISLQTKRTTWQVKQKPDDERED
jgi:hypothetical protein